MQAKSKVRDTINHKVFPIHSPAVWSQVLEFDKPGPIPLTKRMNGQYNVLHAVHEMLSIEVHERSLCKVDELVSLLSYL